MRRQGARNLGCSWDRYDGGGRNNETPQSMEPDHPAEIPELPLLPFPPDPKRDLSEFPSDRPGDQGAGTQANDVPFRSMGTSTTTSRGRAGWVGSVPGHSLEASRGGAANRRPIRTAWLAGWVAWHMGPSGKFAPTNAPPGWDREASSSTLR